jgi:hypothetical protein
VTILTQLAALLRDMPHRQVDDLIRAAWFDRKAAVLAAIADQGGPDADDARDAATQARAEAQRLRGGEP